MAVKLKKIKKKNPLHLNIVKWYLTQKKTRSVGSNEIAKEIEGRSALSLGDVQSTLSNLVEMIPLFLKLGQTIKLEGFGSFRVTVQSEGTDTAEESLNAVTFLVLFKVIIPRLLWRRFGGATGVKPNSFAGFPRFVIRNMPCP